MQAYRAGLCALGWSVSVRTPGGGPGRHPKLGLYGAAEGTGCHRPSRMEQARGNILTLRTNAAAHSLCLPDDTAPLALPNVASTASAVTAAIAAGACYTPR